MAMRVALSSTRTRAAASSSFASPTALIRPTCSIAILSPFTTRRRYFSNDTVDPILYSHKGEGVWHLRFNRPSQLNAMNVAMGEQFQAVVSHITRSSTFPGSDQTPVRAIVLSGEGRAFSAGGDLDFLLARCNDTPFNNRGLMRAFYSRFLSLRALPVPIIAAINGPAVGAGLCVALACDVRIASPSANLGLNFTQLGLHPGMGVTHYLPRIVGPATASQLLLTGELFSGDRARELGVVSAVDPSPVEAAFTIAFNMARNPPVGVQTLVRSLRAAQDVGLDTSLQYEADAQVACYATAEFRAKIEALKNKPATKATKAKA